MNSLLRSSSSALATLTLSALSLPAAAGDLATQDSLCADNGHCYLDRWTPALAGDEQLFGAAVALHPDGQTAAVGAPGADRVRLFNLVDGSWVPGQSIESPSGPDAEFGAALAFYGKRLVIGAPGDDQTHPDAGAAFVYQRGAGDFTFEQTLFSPLTEADGHFGAAVDGADLWLAVGEPQGGNSGRAIAFRLLGGLYTLHDVLDVPGTGNLGFTLACDGNDVAVGASGDDAFGPNSGSVFVFSLSPTSMTSFTPVLPSDGMTGDAFGCSVGYDGGRLIVGAQGSDSLASNGGAAYLFRKTLPGGAPVFFDEIEKLLPCDMEANAFFGNRVAISGDRAVVGSPLENGVLEPGGKSYVFRETGITTENWTLEEQLRASESSLDDRFGSAVALEGDKLLIGAVGVDELGSAAGAAYYFTLTHPEFGGGSCLCDLLAGVESLGTGKPGASGTPELSLSKPLSPGNLSLVKVTQLTESTVPFLVWGLQPGAIPFDGGVLHMTDPRIVQLPTVSALGQVGLPIDLGLAPALCGAEVLLQVLVVDPGAAGDFMTAQSNGLRARIGQ